MFETKKRVEFDSVTLVLSDLLLGKTVSGQGKNTQNIYPSLPSFF